MSYYMDLMREVSTICLAMTLNNSERFVQNIDPKQLAPVEYVNLLGAAAGRIGGCAAYEPAEAAAAAARVAVRAGAVYDRANGEQTLVVIKLITRYLRYQTADFRKGEEVAGLTNMLKLWIEVWTRAESAIDLKWRADDTFPPFDPGRPHDVTEGQTPESVSDPTLRALYTAHLARKTQFLQRMRDQMLLRRALEEAREDYISYAGYLSKVAGMRQPLDAAAAAVTDPSLKAALSPSTR